MVKIILCAATLTLACAASSINWGPCRSTSDPRTQCAFVAVPLDHLDKNNKATIDIAVQRYLAVNGTSKGTIFLNPGGPGGAGTGMAGEDMAFITGGQYDMLGFDPRGVGLSRPVLCSKNGFTSAEELKKISNKQIPFDEVTAETSLDRYGAEYAVMVKRCQKYDGDYLQYLSTAFVARDMDFIREALGEPVLNYYGVSYGTLLGATYVNMFPDRVGRVLIDSVLTPSLYSGPAAALLGGSLRDIERIFNDFAAQCESAGTTLCPLASTAKGGKLADRIRDFLAKTGESPLIVASGGDFATVTGTDIRRLMLGAMYSPAEWPQMADFLLRLMTGGSWFRESPDSCQPVSPYRGNQMEFAIYVGNDGDNLGDQCWEEELLKSKQLSPLFGVGFFSGGLAVKYWDLKPVERYAGPWNNKLKNPILILNNEFDPVTPLHSAQDLATLMGPSNAVLATRDGYGHGAVFSQPSRCIHTLVTSFYNNGTLPAQNTNCNIDRNPFDPPSMSESLDASIEKHTKAASNLISKQMF